jgi:UDP:flavonoid glycosyltransferase YjiC (YdhE family)
MSLPSDLSKPLLLIFPFDLLSHYLRCLQLARIFKKRYAILFAHSESYSSFVENEGFGTFKCKNFEAREVMECAVKFDFSWLNEVILEELFLDQVRCLTELKPTFVIGDTSPTLKMATEKIGIKYVSLMNGYMSRYYEKVRKLSRTHPAYKYSQQLPENVIDWITKFAERLAFHNVHKPFKKIRKKYSLSKQDSYLKELEGDQNLICDLPELFPQKVLPSNYKWIAPLFHSNSKVSSRQVVHQLDPEKKTIFVSMGSSGDWSKVSFLNDEYFKKFNIITAADRFKVLNGQHIIKEHFVNANNLFPSTDLVICHGGNGTIYQALFFGIPVLCKTSHFEQEWNVQAIERSCLGRSLDNIHSVENIIPVIEEWILKKDTGLFHSIKSRIREEIGRFEKSTFKF